MELIKLGVDGVGHGRCCDYHACGDVGEWRTPNITIRPGETMTIAVCEEHKDQAEVMALKAIGHLRRVAA